jgi:hypothetical protein
MWRVAWSDDRLWGGADGLWWGLTECPVRSMGVVVRRVPVEQAPQVPVVEDNDPLEKLRWSVPTSRSEIAFVRGACGGVLMISIPQAPC